MENRLKMAKAAAERLAGGCDIALGRGGCGLDCMEARGLLSFSFWGDDAKEATGLPGKWERK